MGLFGEVGDYYRSEHYDAAEDLSRCHALAQDHRSCQNSEHGFQAKDQRCNGRCSFLLAQHLEGVGDAAADNAGVQDGEPSCHDIRQAYGALKDEHADDSQKS